MKKVIALVVFLFAFVTVNGQKDSTVDVGDPAFEINGYDENGNEIKLSDYKGDKYVLLNFTATYCGPCWATFNQMNEVQEKYEDELKVISIHWDELRDQWEKIAKHNNINFECTSIWEARGKDRIMDVYQIDGWPYFFIIDKEGVIVAKWFGARERKLKRMLRRRIK